MKTDTDWTRHADLIYAEWDRKAQQYVKDQKRQYEIALAAAMDAMTKEIRK